MLLVAVLLLALPARGQTTPDSTSIHAVRAVLDSQAAAWNNGDIDGYMRGYWKSDSMLFTSGGNIQRGWTAARDKYKRSYSTKAMMGSLTFRDVEVRPLSEASAWVFGRWMLERAKDRPHGVFTLVVRKFPDGWKIVHDHTSVEIPKPEPPVKKH